VLLARALRLASILELLCLYLHFCRLATQLTAEAFALTTLNYPRKRDVVGLLAIFTVLVFSTLQHSKVAVSSMEPLELACHYPLLLEPINRSLRKNAALLSADSIPAVSATSQLTQQSIYRQSAPLKLSSTLTRPAINPSASWKESAKTERQKDSTALDMVGTVHTASLGRGSHCPT
jgi:hypothetical protein